ncbi:hypothetical protein I4U23_029895 [Adineta vaga]|nr:hypothetical protein I4U23_029895 [Adineta vaga]
MMVFTIPLFIFLILSLGHVYSYPSVGLHNTMINNKHDLKDFYYQQMLNNEKTYKLLNMNNEKQFPSSYIDYIHKRLIDF